VEAGAVNGHRTGDKSRDVDGEAARRRATVQEVNASLQQRVLELTEANAELRERLRASMEEAVTGPAPPAPMDLGVSPEGEGVGAGDKGLEAIEERVKQLRAVVDYRGRLIDIRDEEIAQLREAVDQAYERGRREAQVGAKVTSIIVFWQCVCSIPCAFSRFVEPRLIGLSLRPVCACDCNGVMVDRMELRIGMFATFNRQ